MTALGKAIFELDQKVKALVDVLHAAGEIEAPTTSALAAALKMSAKTLRSAVGASRLSQGIETKLAAIGRFSKKDPEWVDVTASDNDRSTSKVGSAGTDSAKEFRRMLHERWSIGRQTITSTELGFEVVDEEVGSHLITLGQGSRRELDVQLLLQADFATMWDGGGIQYGFSRARLHMKINGPPGLKTAARMGRLQPETIRNAHIVARGTDRLPVWDILCLSDGEVLDGEYSTKDAPLVCIGGCVDGMVVETRLCVNIFDGFVAVGPDSEAISANKLSIIESACSKEFFREIDSSGRVRLSTHKLKFCEERNG